MWRKWRLLGLAFVLLLSLSFAACGSSEDKNASGSDDNRDSSNDGTKIGDKDITIPFVAWAGVEARTHLLAKVLEDVGYNVDLKEVEAGPMFSSLANGSADLGTVLWLPTTHQEYWDKYKDKLTKVNKVLDKAPLALTVPKYMKDVNKTKDLKNNKKLGEATDWTITGIDPGAGIMHSAKKAIKKYDLGKWHLQESSEAAMLSKLKKAYKEKKPIIITGWKPHYMFAEWDLKMLDDPQDTFGGKGDQIYLIARKGIKDDSPAAYQIFKQYTENYDQLNDLMGKIHGGKDPDDVAEKFIKDHPDKVKEWEKGVDKK